MCVASLQTKIEERSLLFLDASIDSFCKHCLKDGTVSKNKATADVFMSVKDRLCKKIKKLDLLEKDEKATLDKTKRFCAHLFWQQYLSRKEFGIIFRESAKEYTKQRIEAAGGSQGGRRG